MMMFKKRTSFVWLSIAASLLVLHVAPLCAQNPAPESDRAKAYYHAALAAQYASQGAEQGRIDLVNKAIEEYKYALNLEPNSASLNGSLASLYFSVGRVREAESTARALLAASPDDIEAHKLLGRLYLRQLGEGQSAATVLDQAIAEHEKLASLQPNEVEPRMILGQLYTIKHDAKKAEAAFAAARAIEPDSEEIILNMVRLYAGSGDVQRAAQTLESVPVEDRSPKMEFALGAAYDQLKKLPEAIAAYRRAIVLEPDDLHSVDALAQALLANNQLDEAYKQYETLSKTDPENASAYVRMSEILRRQGRFEPALEMVRKARKIEPNSLDAGFNEGLLLDILGRFDDAIRVYAEMVDLTSHANGAYTNEEKGGRSIFLGRLANICLEQNKTEQALAAYQKLVELGDDYASNGYQGQVDVYRAAKQYAKATEVARKAVEALPKNRELKFMLANQLADQKQEAEGFALMKGMIANTAEDRAVYLTLGQMHIRLHQWKEAEEAFNKAEAYSKQKDDRAYLLFLRGELAERQKRYDLAEQFFRKVLEIDPNSALTLNYYGYMLADKSTRLPEALKLIRKAVDLEPMNGAYLDSLGWCYFKMGDYELAENNLRKAVDRNQTDPTVHDHLGDLYEKTGRVRLAAAQWEIALKQFAITSPGDFDSGDVAKVQKKYDGARTKLAKQESELGPGKHE